MVDKLTDNSKNSKLRTSIIFALSLTILSMIIGWLISPYVINTYFDNQPILTIGETRWDIANYSKVIILYGYVSNVKDDYFTLVENLKINNEIIDGRIIDIRYTNKLNCIPKESTHHKIAGAWNTRNKINPLYYENKQPDAFHSNEDFYAVWIVGGCN